MYESKEFVQQLPFIFRSRNPRVQGYTHDAGFSMMQILHDMYRRGSIGEFHNPYRLDVMVQMLYPGSWIGEKKMPDQTDQRMNPSGPEDQEPIDDGRTVADMNVDGMPWYVPGDEDRTHGGRHEQMTKEELRAYRWAALKAALLVAAVFGSAFFLFLLFCDFIWFR